MVTRITRIAPVYFLDWSSSLSGVWNKILRWIWIVGWHLSLRQSWPRKTKESWSIFGFWHEIFGCGLSRKNRSCSGGWWYISVHTLGTVRVSGRRLSIRAGSSFTPRTADDMAGPSSSVPPSPLSFDVEWQHFQVQVNHIDERVTSIADQVAQMSQNLTAYFHHVGFTPPFPPIP